MAACVVWLDSEHAKVFSITAGGVQKREMKLHQGTKHSNDHQKTHKQQLEEKFFHEIAGAVGKVEELLVFGPGQAKLQFKHHLESHHHGDLAKHLIGCETLDKMTDNQVLEQARKFFKKYNTYNSTI